LTCGRIAGIASASAAPDWDAQPAVTTLRLLLHDASAELRLRGVDALGQLGPKAADAVDDLIAMAAGDASAAVRAQAIAALARLGPRVLDAPSAVELGKWGMLE